MSYVEKALYRYIKTIFTSGLRVLFSKKYILYTIAFILITINSTVFYLIQKGIHDHAIKDTLGKVVDILIAIELSAAISYLIFGMFFSRYALKYWIIPLILTIGGGAVLIHFIPDISPFVAALCYIGWIIVSVFLTFALSRNFFGNKVLGSVMFLGKSAEEGSILFSGVVFVLSLVNTGCAGYLIYSAVVNTIQISLIIVALTVIIAVAIINFVIFKLGKKDDVFYTILAFFYVFSSFTLWKLTIYTYRGDAASDNVGSMLITLFFIFYTMSNYGKKVKKIEKQVAEEFEESVIEGTVKKKKREEEEEEALEKWSLLKIPFKLGPLGVLMSIMGLVLGYHVTYLQFLSEEDLFSGIFFMNKTELAGLKDKFALILIAFLIIYFLLSYRWSEGFREYSSPELYRFEFLPPFEELVERIERIKSGEESWKDYAKMAIKEGTKIGVKSAARKAFVSPTKRVTGAITGAYSSTKKNITRVFSWKKKDD